MEILKFESIISQISNSIHGFKSKLYNIKSDLYTWIWVIFGPDQSENRQKFGEYKIDFNRCIVPSEVV